MRCESKVKKCNKCKKVPDRWPTEMIHYHSMAKLTGDWMEYQPPVHNVLIEIENMVGRKIEKEIERARRSSPN